MLKEVIILGLQHTLKALSDPIRREILNLLKKGRLSAGEISEHFAVTDASMSRHLSVLKCTIRRTANHNTSSGIFIVLQFFFEL